MPSEVGAHARAPRRHVCPVLLDVPQSPATSLNWPSHACAVSRSRLRNWYSRLPWPRPGRCRVLVASAVDGHHRLVGALDRADVVDTPDLGGVGGRVVPVDEHLSLRLVAGLPWGWPCCRSRACRPDRRGSTGSPGRRSGQAPAGRRCRPTRRRPAPRRREAMSIDVAVAGDLAHDARCRRPSCTGARAASNCSWVMVVGSMPSRSADRPTVSAELGQVGQLAGEVRREQDVQVGQRAGDLLVVAQAGHARDIGCREHVARIPLTGLVDVQQVGRIVGRPAVSIGSSQP